MEKNADSDTSKLLIKLKDAPKPILFLWIIFVSSIDIPLIIIFDERIITPSEDFSLILVMIVCFVISFFFNFLIHELSHFLAYLFFNIPAKMSLTECKAFSKCFVWQYKYICLSPLLSWIVLQTITIIFVVISDLHWFPAILSLANFICLAGTARDIYWLAKIGKLPPDCPVLDHGKEAEVFSSPSVNNQ